MSEAAARLAALALIAVIAAATAVAARGDRHEPDLPRPVGGWRTAVAARGSPGTDACGVAFGTTAGLRSDVLPCGVKLYVRRGGHAVLTQVVDHARPSHGATFDVSPPLARLLGLGDRGRVEWSFVR